MKYIGPTPLNWHVILGHNKCYVICIVDASDQHDVA